MHLLNGVASLAFVVCMGSSSHAFQTFSKSRISSRTPLFMATWSDARAVREYQNFLSTGKLELDKTADCPSIIVTSDKMDPCPLAKALMSVSGSHQDVVLQAGEPIPVMDCPIYVTLPATELAHFLQTGVDPDFEKRENLVFFSGGLEYANIEQVLKNNGLCRDDTTQVVCTGFLKSDGRFEDNSIGLGQDAMGEAKRAGETYVCGKWGGSIEERLLRKDIECKILFYREWRRHMWERTMLDSVFHLVGAVRTEPTTLKDVSLYYEKEVSDIMWQITNGLRGSMALTLAYGFEERLYSMADVDDEPCTLKPELYPYLYGLFDRLSATHAQYINYAKDERGLLAGLEIPQFWANAADKPSIMRQGNFRADGVI